MRTIVSHVPYVRYHPGMRSENSEAKTAKARSEVRTPGVATVRTVFAMVSANATTQFAIQAWMSYRFAKDVWAIPRPLCAAIIVALDLFAVTFMVFTYLLRTASLWSRLYVWGIFAIGVGAQLFAAELYGSHETWPMPVRIFAALPALFLASSLHGLIVWRNHSTKSAPPSAPAVVTPPPITTHRMSEITSAVLKVPALRPERPRVASAKPAARPAGDQREKWARLVVENGERAADIAPKAGVSKRAVEQWAKEYRERHPGPRPAPIRDSAGFGPGPLDGISEANHNGVPHGA